MSEAIRLDLGVPGYAPPERALRAAAEASLASNTGYAPASGWPDLREALAEYVHQRHGIRCAADEIVVTVGASAGLFAALAAMTRPGDRVLIPDPGYPAYRRLAAILNLVPIPYRLTSANGYRPDFAHLARSLGRRTPIIIWNSPANPTGVVAAPDVVLDLLAFAGRHDLRIISDEVFNELVFEGKHSSPLAHGPRDLVVGVFSFSKTYALPGWRVGWVVASPATCTAIQQIHWATNMSPCTAGQIAARECLREPDAYHARVLAELRAQRDLAVAALAAAGVHCPLPTGGIFLWADVVHLTDDVDSWARMLWSHQRVAVMSGRPFGNEGSGRVRILFSAQPEVLSEGLNRIVTFCRVNPNAEVRGAQSWTGGS
jgi:aspartate aminotransferase/aminotransferase